MTSYFLFTPNFNHAFNGSYTQCMGLSDRLIRQGTYDHLKVARARAGEERASIIFDITPETTKQALGIRGVSSRALKKLCSASPLEF